MKRLLLLLSCCVTPPALAWDPVSVFQNAVQGQINHQIRRNVAEAFRSIPTPTAGTRPADAEIRDARPGEVVLYAPVAIVSTGRPLLATRNISTQPFPTSHSACDGLSASHFSGDWPLSCDSRQ